MWKDEFNTCVKAFSSMTMAVLHRALFTWLVLLVFLILLVLRLDSRTQWNWFIVFLPLWVYDSILLIYVLINMISLCKGYPERMSVVRRKVWYIMAIVLKMATQIILCLKLEYPSWNISIIFVMLPMWTLLPVLLIDVFITLIIWTGYWNLCLKMFEWTLYHNNGCKTSGN